MLRSENGREWGTGGAMESVYKSPADLDKNAGPTQNDGVGLRICKLLQSQATPVVPSPDGAFGTIALKPVTTFQDPKLGAFGDRLDFSSFIRDAKERAFL